MVADDAVHGVMGGGGDRGVVGSRGHLCRPSRGESSAEGVEHADAALRVLSEPRRDPVRTSSFSAEAKRAPDEDADAGADAGVAGVEGRPGEACGEGAAGS